MKQYRQGDLLFIQAENFGGKVHKTNSLVVLGSNITGHDHSITKGEVYTHEPTWQDRANFYVSIPLEGAEITHPEHKSIPLSEGIYKVIRQREVNGYVRD